MHNATLFHTHSSLKSEVWSIDDVQPRNHYPRLHNARMHQRMRNHIHRYGQTSPVIIDPDGFILDGYLTWLTMKKLGFKEIVVIVFK